MFSIALNAQIVKKIDNITLKVSPIFKSDKFIPKMVSSDKSSFILRSFNRGGSESTFTEFDKKYNVINKKKFEGYPVQFGDNYIIIYRTENGSSAEIYNAKFEMLKSQKISSVDGNYLSVKSGENGKYIVCLETSKNEASNEAIVYLYDSNLILQWSKKILINTKKIKV